MKISQYIILTKDNKEKFFTKPFNLNIENFVLTGFDSIKYMPLSSYLMVIIDYQQIAPLLRKVSLGIKDSPELESLWELCFKQLKTFILTDKLERPTQDMLNLEIEYILPANIEAAFAELKANMPKNQEPKTHRFTTADDIRDLYNQGANSLPANLLLTPWAKEISDSLDLKQKKENLLYFLPVTASSTQQLKSQHETLHSLSAKYQNLYFIVNSLYLHTFNKLFPTLKYKKVAETIHWSENGAFTGEISSLMLADTLCNKAVVPTKTPYTDPSNLLALQKTASKNNISLFSTFTLASQKSCDIIHSEPKNQKSLFYFYRIGTYDLDDLPASGAIEVNVSILEKIKGRYV